MSNAGLSKVDSFQYPAAHIGHLSPAQQSSLDAFKELCTKEGYYKPEGQDGKSEASHDDETLLRYLRARKFIPKDALDQFKDTEEWRAANHVEELYKKIDVTEYDETRKLYPQWTGRRDRRGIPVYVFEVAPLTTKALAAYDQLTAKIPPPVKFDASKTPAKMLRLFALYENMMTFILPLCTAVKGREYPETPISQSNNIVDISKVGLKQFWNLKSHMQDASTLATAHYPETLDRIFIIGAPAFFPTVWGWIKRWFDPITVSKIFILGANDVKPTLERYIDPANIPKKYGGQLDFEFGKMPNIEPEIEEVLVWENPSLTPDGRKTFPTGPIKWIPNAQGELCATAVGTADGAQRSTVVARLAPGHTLKPDIQPAGTANKPLLERYETGVSTHPTDEGAPLESEPSSSGPSGTTTPNNGLAVGNEPVPNKSVANVAPTALNPAHPDVDEVSKTLQGVRVGTSETRYEQQDPTHAAGQAVDGTPAIRDHGDGDKTVTMEPNTVGQAPKDVTKPIAGVEPPAAPGYVDQAKAVAGQAVNTATAVAGQIAGAVGLGGQKEETKETEVAKAEDARVDATGDKKMEEYLRSTVPSQTKDNSTS